SASVSQFGDDEVGRLLQARYAALVRQGNVTSANRRFDTCWKYADAQWAWRVKWHDAALAHQAKWLRDPIISRYSPPTIPGDCKWETQDQARMKWWGIFQRYLDGIREAEMSRQTLLDDI